MLWFGRKRLNLNDRILPFSEIRKRARILVIDDDENAFPYELLRKEGYNVTYWKKIESLKGFEGNEYDLIVLDILNIVDEKISPTGGIGILEHIKKANPAQLIIAYSGQKYDLSHEKFWRIADDYLGKPSSLITCKEKIDSLLKSNFTPQHYWEVIKQVLINEGADKKKLDKFESALSKSIKTGDPQPFSKVLPLVTLGHHTFALVNSLISIILRFYQ